MKNSIQSDIFAAKSNNEEMNRFVRRHEPYIIKCTSKMLRRYVNTNDDEWSVALSAFVQAVKNYNEEKGNFYSFVELIIKRRLTDHLRTSQKYRSEISVDPALFSLEFEDEESNVFLYTPELKRQLIQPNQDALKYEIEAVEHELKKYGFDFFDLTDCSPKAEKTKKACAAAVRFIINEPALLSAVRATRTLPVKLLQTNCKLPPKLLERHRKYIIAAVEIMTRDCPYLAEYMRYIRKESCK